MSKSVLAEYLLGVGLMLGPWVSSNLLRLLVGLLLLIGWLLVCRPLWLLRLLEGLLLEGGLLVGGLDRLLGSWLEVSLLSSWLLLDRGRPLLLNLLEVLEPTLLRSSCCWLCPLLLLPHSDHLQHKVHVFFPQTKLSPFSLALAESWRLAGVPSLLPASSSTAGMG